MVFLHLPACLLPFSLPSSSIVLRISNRIPQNHRYTISSNRLQCSPRSHSKSHLSPHRSLSHLLPHHLTQHSRHRIQPSH
ncbi:hypothetical protein H4582DRAFT_2005630 [Lactarius indigo]|nr:hypothetical protein H4582DRAFT_2005630 [Lactarius indigo]